MRHLRHKQMIANQFTNKSPCCALATLEIFDQNQARSEETAIPPATRVEQQCKSEEMEIDEKNSRGGRGKKEATEKKKSTYEERGKKKRREKRTRPLEGREGREGILSSAVKRTRFRPGWEKSAPDSGSASKTSFRLSTALFDVKISGQKRETNLRLSTSSSHFHDWRVAAPLIRGHHRSQKKPNAKTGPEFTTSPSRQVRLAPNSHTSTSSFPKLHGSPLLTGRREKVRRL